MAAPKFNHNLSLKSDSNKTEPQNDSVKSKAEIEAYKNKITELLKNPKNVKKAVLILEKMLHSKKS